MNSMNPKHANASPPFRYFIEGFFFAREKGFKRNKKEKSYKILAKYINRVIRSNFPSCFSMYCNKFRKICYRLA